MGIVLVIVHVPALAIATVGVQVMIIGADRRRIHMTILVRKARTTHQMMLMKVTMKIRVLKAQRHIMRKMRMKMIINK